jgi:hypothetical protein
VCSPTPLSAASEVLDLMAGSSRLFRVGIYRVRPLRPVRSPLPRGFAPDGCWHACKNCNRTGTLTTGTAPAFGRALAPCNGSDLLSLRLLSTCSWVTWFFAPPQGGVVASFARLARSTPRRIPSAPRRCCGRAFWRGGLAETRRCVLVFTVATVTLWVTASVRASKHGPDLTRLGRGF